MIVGIAAVAIAASCLGIMPTMQKQLLVNGLPMNSLMFFTNLTITAVCFVMSRIKRNSLRVKAPQAIQALLMGITGMLLTTLLLNNSYLYLPVGTAMMLNFLYPSIVCIVMGVVFREGLSKLQIMAIVASVVGLACLTGAGGKLPATGVVLALASAFTYGGYMIANEKGPANDLTIEVKLFYVSLPGTLLFGVLAPFTHTLVAPAGGLGGWMMLIGGSGFFMVGGYLLMMYGVSRLGASTASFVSMLEPIVSIVFGTIWFRDPMTSGALIGGALIISGILLIAVDGYKKQGKQAYEFGKV